mgnify:CR=1 FL=1
MSYATLPTEPDTIGDYLAKEAPNAERIVDKRGKLATRLTRALERRGVPITCIDARMAHKALSARLNKSVQVYAEGLAQLARPAGSQSPHLQRIVGTRAAADRSARTADPQAQES